MPLSFPNPSRSYDATNLRIRFWAHDRSMEIPFFVTVNALLKLDSGFARNETAMLAIFDAHRNRIHSAADKIRSTSKKNSYVLDVGDL